MGDSGTSTVDPAPMLILQDARPRPRPLLQRPAAPSTNYTHDHYHYHYDHCHLLDVYHIAFVVFFFNRSRPVEQENNKSNIDTNLQTGHTDNVHVHVFIMLLFCWLVFLSTKPTKYKVLTTLK